MKYFGAITAIGMMATSSALGEVRLGPLNLCHWDATCVGQCLEGRTVTQHGLPCTTPDGQEYSRDASGRIVVSAYAETTEMRNTQAVPAVRLRFPDLEDAK